MGLESSFSVRINFPKQAFLKEVYNFFLLFFLLRDVFINVCWTVCSVWQNKMR